MRPLPMAVSIGVRLGSYEITGALGAGGMGEVYRASDTRIGRDVAIKMFVLNWSEELLQRLAAK
jgi:serine/threonine protein kinase